MENKLNKNDAENIVMEMVEAIIDNNNNDNNLEIPKSSKSQDENAQQQREQSQVGEKSQKRGKKIQIYSEVNLK